MWYRYKSNWCAKFEIKVAFETISPSICDMRTHQLNCCVVQTTICQQNWMPRAQFVNKFSCLKRSKIEKLIEVNWCKSHHRFVTLKLNYAVCSLNTNNSINSINFYFNLHLSYNSINTETEFVWLPTKWWPNLTKTLMYDLIDPPIFHQYHNFQKSKIKSKRNSKCLLCQQDAAASLNI